MIPSPHKKLYVLALKMLTRREHAVAELRKKLMEKTDHPELIPEVIQDLIQKKYLDDERFTENYSRMLANKGYGLLRIKRALKEKGVTESNNISHADIKEVYNKKFKNRDSSDLREKAKQFRYLQYRGFSFEEIKKVINHEDDE